MKKEIKNNSTDSETLATIVEEKDIGPEIAGKERAKETVKEIIKARAKLNSKGKEEAKQITRAKAKATRVPKVRKATPEDHSMEGAGLAEEAILAEIVKAERRVDEENM